MNTHQHSTSIPFHAQICKTLSASKKGDRILCSLESIATLVANRFGVTVNQLNEAGRKHQVCLARHAYCYLACKGTFYTLNQIARQTGGRDHSTVIHSRNAASDLIFTSPDFKRMIENLMAELKGEPLPHNYEMIDLRTKEEKAEKRIRVRSIKDQETEQEIEEPMPTYRAANGNGYSFKSRHC